MNMTTIKGALFDCDGVVADTMRDHAEAWVRAFAEHGMEVSRDWVYEYEGAPFRELALAFFSRLKRSPTYTQVNDLSDLKENIFQKIHSPRLYAGITPIFDRLKERGVRIGLVTGASRQAIERVLPLELIDRFDAIVTGDDVKRGKPDPEPYIKGAERLGFKGNECCVVENALFGIRSAKAAGIYCIALATTLSPEMLADADMVLNNHEELLKII